MNITYIYIYIGSTSWTHARMRVAIVYSNIIYNKRSSITIILLLLYNYYILYNYMHNTTININIYIYIYYSSIM